MEQTPAARFIDVLGRLGYKTQQQIADLLQIARPTAGTIVRQEREPSFADVCRLKAQHSEVNIDWIFTGIGEALTRNLTPATQLPPPIPSKHESTRQPSEGGGLSLSPKSAQEEIAYLRDQLAKRDSEMQQLREQMALAQDRNHEREMQLIKTIGGANFSDASSDAADDYDNPYMGVSHYDHDQYRQQVAAVYAEPAVATWMEYVASR